MKRFIPLALLVILTSMAHSALAQIPTLTPMAKNLCIEREGAEATFFSDHNSLVEYVCAPSFSAPFAARLYQNEGGEWIFEIKKVTNYQQVVNEFSAKHPYPVKGLSGEEFYKHMQDREKNKHTPEYQAKEKAQRTAIDQWADQRIAFYDKNFKIESTQTVLSPQEAEKLYKESVALYKNSYEKVKPRPQPKDAIVNDKGEIIISESIEIVLDGNPVTLRYYDGSQFHSHQTNHHKWTNPIIDYFSSKGVMSDDFEQ